MPIPIRMTQNERRQSLVNIAWRISVRFAISGPTCSAGNVFKADISLVEMKLSKNIVGKRAMSRQMPPVRAKERMRYFLAVRTAKNSRKASMARRGMVNSAMTRMEATVRNFAYIGM